MCRKCAAPEWGPTAAQNLDCHHYITKQETLQDNSSSGRIRPWAKKKTSTHVLSMICDKLGDDESDSRWYRIAERLDWCGESLTFAENEATKEKKLVSANFCKYRLCPMCSWRRSLKCFSNMMKIMDVCLDPGKLKKFEDVTGSDHYTGKYEFLFVTLTVVNCSNEQLSQTIDELFSGYQKMVRSLRVKRSVKGWYRALEVTYNEEEDTFHPHLHCIWIVPSSFFKDPGLYISQRELTAIWKKSMGLAYGPIVDVRKIKTEDGTAQGIARAVAEATKYTVKDGDFVDPCDIEKSKYLTKVIDSALKARRLVSFGGVLKKIRSYLQLEDEMDGDLVHVDGQEEKDLSGWVVKCYAWNLGFRAYVLQGQKDYLAWKADQLQERKCLAS